MDLAILYRGPLSSCNYECWYCPFAKHQESPAELAQDRAALERFVGWIADHPEHTFGILFTPWGEALIRKWYQDALVRLSALSQVRRVAIQTNLSCKLDWIDACDRSRLALWTTFHPTEISRERFVAQCLDLDRRGVRFSVGVVGLRENHADIESLRRELPDHIYLWVNAYKDQPNYYSEAEARSLTEIDPLFAYNNTRHASRGKACRGGHTVISVDGAGTVRRCHFIKEPLGNLYESDLAPMLRPRPCTNDTCGCHIGYVHLEELKLYDVFGAGVLERVPMSLRTTAAAPSANP